MSLINTPTIVFPYLVVKLEKYSYINEITKGSYAFLSLLMQGKLYIQL